MARAKDDPRAVDDYLAGLPADQSEALSELRHQIKAAAPDVTERISYGTTIIFALGQDLVGCVAQAQHLSFYTMSPQLARSMKDEIRRTHKVSGATIHVTAEDPLPPELVERIVTARVQEQQPS